MGPRLASIVRTGDADEDLQVIGAYGASQWGLDSAIEFVRGFDEAFALLMRHPDVGRRRDELGDGVRSWLHRSHVIYYLHVGEEVVIGRILHGSIEPASRFDLNDAVGHLGQ